MGCVGRMCHNCDFVKCGILVVLVLMLISHCGTISGFESRKPYHYLRQEPHKFNSWRTDDAAQKPKGISVTLPRLGFLNSYFHSYNPKFG